MNQTRTQRIHQGFHRIGAVLAGILILLAVILIAADYLWELDDPDAMLKLMLAFAATAVAAYALSRAIGWIIVGFTGD